MQANYLENEEKSIRKSVLLMGSETCHAIEKAIQCYQQMNGDLVDEFMLADQFINKMEKDVEHDCIKLIALQQPIAHDLRELLTDLNIAKELERIADYAVSIAKIVNKMPNKQQEIESKILTMAEFSLAMLSKVLVCYAEEDANMAKTIALTDDELDDLENSLKEEIFKKMELNPENAISCTYQLWIIHQFERIGDRVTNIAENIVFQSNNDVVNLN